MITLQCHKLHDVCPFKEKVDKMFSNDFWVLLAILAYFVVVLTIGFVYAKRSNSSTEEYFLGGRKVGPWLTALSAEASDMSGYLLMGIPGLAYFTGAADAGWTVIGLAIGTWANWHFTAKRLRKYSEVASDAITLPDFYSRRLHDDKNIISTIAALIILLFFCVYVGSCFVTCGKLFHTLFGIDYMAMMVLGALIVFLYTLVGGYLSVVVTDFVQGCLMFFALAVVMIGSITLASGVENTISFLQDIPGYFSLLTNATPQLGSDGNQIVQDAVPVFQSPQSMGVLTIVSYLAWGLGYFGMPHVLVRFMGIRNADELRKSKYIAVVWVVISMFCAVAIGLIGRVVVPTELLTNSAAENIFIVLSRMLLPGFMCGVVVSGILAASMSSASGYLLIAGSSVAEDLYRGVIKKDATDNQVMIVSRIVLICVFLLGIVIASDENSIIFKVVSFAWAGLGASFGPLTLCCLYWRRLNKPGAIAGMLTGGISVIAWKYLLSPLGGLFSIYELLPCFFIALAVMIIVSLLTPPPEDSVLDEFDHYMDEPMKGVQASA